LSGNIFSGYFHVLGGTINSGEKFDQKNLLIDSLIQRVKNNQTVVMQPQSSGSSSMTIYDPVRDSNALIRQGQRMLSGRCTLGINC